MKLSTRIFNARALLLGGALLMSSTQAGSHFNPESKEELQAAAIEYCNGTWSGPKVRYWEVANITNFDHLFADSGDCNPDVEKWDVAQATSLQGMFANASGFDHDLTKWDITLGADVSDFFDRACPPNASAVIDSEALNPAGVLFDPSRKACLDCLSPYIPVVELGELLERCTCDGDLGFNSNAECVSCADSGMQKRSNGICVPICPPGAENYGDTCKCTSDNEVYDSYENKCLCIRGTYGFGNATCAECPEHTYYKSGTYAGFGTVQERCECENAYEEWSAVEHICVCSVGAFGDGNDDCKECPKQMEANDDVGPGTGDKGDRCQCLRSKTTEYDEEEEECVCKRGSYEKSSKKCEECKKVDGLEGKDGVEEGLGDLDERCQCKDDTLTLVGGLCI